MKTGSKELIRDINTNLVLEKAIEKGLSSRASIAKELGLTKATVSSIVQELINRMLIIERGSGESDYGRKPTLIEFNGQAGYTICIDLGVSTLSVMITDLLGNQCYLKRSPADEQQSKQDRLVHLYTLLDQVISTIPSSPYGVVGITIGIHGVVHMNQICFTPYYDFLDLNLSELLFDRYHIPVYLYNEANLSVLGEKTFSMPAENIANISIHSGIGLGLVLNNRLYEGYNGYAGEFGHTIIEMNGIPCPCGNQGCIEQYASKRAILHLLANRKQLKKITFEDYCQLYESNDRDALYVTEQFIKVLSIGISNLLNVFNPEIIIVNSCFTTKYPDILEQIKERLHSKVSHYQAIVPSNLPNTSILYGGAYINIVNFLKVKHFNPPL